MITTKKALLESLVDLKVELQRVAADASDAASAASEISSYASDAESNANQAEERANELADQISELEDEVEAFTDSERAEINALALEALSSWHNLYKKITDEVLHTINGDNPFTESDRIALDVIRRIADQADWSFGDFKSPHLMDTLQSVQGDYATQIIIRSLTPQGKINLNDGSVSIRSVVEER